MDVTRQPNETVVAAFVYDGNGRRVKSMMGNEIILFVGAHYEVTGSTVTKYYFAGASRIAMRSNSTLQYLLGDHLGSTSLVTSDTGSLVMETRYKPWGEVRYATANATLPTRYTYTGQYSYINDEATDLGSAGFGLMFYNARWYDPYLNHFTQPDTIVPDPSNSQDWNRYSYARNNPLRYTDPSGHYSCDYEDDAGNCQSYTTDDYIASYRKIIEERYDWSLDSDDWSLEELETIYQTGRDIEAYVDGLTNGVGQEWILDYLGNITITHGENLSQYSETKPTWQGPTIWLGKGWLNDGGWDSKQLLAHELGHVWDIRQGMQGSVQLHEDLGGSGFPWPFRKPDTNVPNWERSVNGGYGNTGINDYFAEAFSWTVYNRTIAPSGASAWIDALITNQVSMYGN